MEDSREPRLQRPLRPMMVKNKKFQSCNTIKWRIRVR
jgi:hypothetical protein